MEWVVELRDLLRLPLEERQNKAFSAANQGEMEAILGLFATADDGQDEGLARLADLLGIPNPDVDDDEEEESDENDTAEASAGDESAERALPIPRDNEFLLELRMLGGGR
jgi:hypothetical protein